ncbi:hypothetical protein KZI27_10180 [Curtobacterium sp. TC1]|uniref:hypothetical protein n=1 Tax=Curtobacterium sp. TC1 TaxID=2862880 RepID=UPI001C9A38C1|nr:hypothetical protein [Curtobacterium sp. TC1]QZQ57135.1 hypothetical protein KZI27_10180 [Curtobacterium sp. TC1]
MFESLNLTPLYWLVTELDMVMQPSSTVDVHEWDRRLMAASGPGLWFSHDEMLTLVQENHQMIDCEFFGVPVAAGPDPAQAVLRIDFFDSTEVTVCIDGSVIEISNAIERALGPAVASHVVGSREGDTTAHHIAAILRTCFDASPDPRSALLRDQVEAVRTVDESVPRIFDIVLAEAPRSDYADGPLPWAVYYCSDEAPLAGEVLVWMLEGRINFVELPWFTTDMPAELPRPDQLILTSTDEDGVRDVR